MTDQEALQIRKLAAELYQAARCHHFKTYYSLYNRKPGEIAFDGYIQSRWEESPIQQAFYNIGSYGYKQLIKAGWDPRKEVPQ